MNGHIINNNLNLYVETFLDKVYDIENRLLYITNNTEYTRPRRIRSTIRTLNRLYMETNELLDLMHLYRRVVVHHHEPLQDSNLYTLYQALQNQNFWQNYREVVSYQSHLISETEERLEGIRNDVLDTLHSLEEEE